MIYIYTERERDYTRYLWILDLSILQCNNNNNNNDNTILYYCIAFLFIRAFMFFPISLCIWSDERKTPVRQPRVPPNERPLYPPLPPPPIVSRARQVRRRYHSSQFAVLSCPVRFVAAADRGRSCARNIVWFLIFTSRSSRHNNNTSNLFGIRLVNIIPSG